MVYTSNYPIFHVTADTVVVAGAGSDLQVLLVRRGGEPYRGYLALPGGFVEIDEDLPDAAAREVAEETGLQLAVEDLCEIGAFGRPGRDPRQRTITIGFLAHIPDTIAVAGADDAVEALWMPAAEVAGLAFDHDEILAAGLRRLGVEEHA